MKNKILILFLTISFVSLSLFPLQSQASVDIQNFRQVNKWLYKGAIPRSEEDFLNLKKIGIKTIISLEWSGVFKRSLRNEKKWCKKAGIKFVHVPMFPLRTPNELSVKKALAVFENSKNLPAYLHCRRGYDRTGFITAAYRIKYDKWTVDDAYKEMVNDGFHRFFFFYWGKGLHNYSK